MPFESILSPREKFLMKKIEIEAQYLEDLRDLDASYHREVNGVSLRHHRSLGSVDDERVILQSIAPFIVDQQIANNIQMPWNASGDPCGDSWSGIKCDSEGFVYFIDLGEHLLGQTPTVNLTVFEPLVTFSHLTTLDLRKCGLTGTLPELWGSFSQVTTIHLSYNDLTGTIPSVWSNLTTLRTLDLANNRITGTLPPSLASLPYLYNVVLNENAFIGRCLTCESGLSPLR